MMNTNNKIKVITMSIIKGINVGITDVTSTYVNGESRSDSKQIEVIAMNLGTISKPGNTTYTGSAIEPIPVVTVILDGVETELVYGTDYELSYSDNINVGTATVTATGIGNFNGTLSETWEITGANFTVIANDQSYEYDGNMHGISITATGIDNNTVTIRYGWESGSYTLTSAPQIKNVLDSGTVYFKVFATNHTDYMGSYNLNIGPKLATLEWGTLLWIYDGEEHSTTCLVSNLLVGDTCVVTLHNNSITEIGTTQVTARSVDALSNPNYVLPNDETRTLTIAAGLFVKLSGIWTPVKKVYKKVSGSWVQQELNKAFSTSEVYKKMN